MQPVDAAIQHDPDLLTFDQQSGVPVMAPRPQRDFATRAQEPKAYPGRHQRLIHLNAGALPSP